MFQEFTKYQGHVNNPKRMAEYTARCFDRAISEMGPTQLNIPRDYFYGEITCEIPKPMRVERGAGGENSLNAAAELLASAKFPVILAGGGVVMGDAVQECKVLAERLGAPVCNGYLRNDSFPASHPLWAGPLGYQGSKAANEADQPGRRGGRAGLAHGALRHAAAARHGPTGPRRPRSSRSRPTTPTWAWSRRFHVGIHGDAKGRGPRHCSRASAADPGLRRHQG
jgi:sulfoacetaldehyde acetyltransferase